MNELPPLPQAQYTYFPNRKEPSIAHAAFSENQMQAYARAAIEAQEARKSVPADNLTPVIQWLEAGCAPKHAATELRLLASATPAPQVSVVKQEPLGFVDSMVLAELAKPEIDWVPIWNRQTGVKPIAVYTHPAPVREPLTIQEVEKINARWSYELHGDRLRFVVREVEAAHGITKDTPKPHRKASADFDLPAPNDKIGDTQ